MNPYTGIPEVDRFISERLVGLPPALKMAIEDDRLFDMLGTHLDELGIEAETSENIKYEMLLVLMQIEPIEDLLPTLAREYTLNPAQTVDIADYIETTLLKNYRTYLENLPDADDEIPETDATDTGEPATIPVPAPVASIPAQTPTASISPTTPTSVQTPPALYRKETVIGARTMQSDIAGIKKEEERKPFIAEKDKVVSAATTPAPSTPTAPPQVTPPPLVRGAIPGTDAPTPAPIPRYSKPLTDLPRYNNLK